MGFQHEGWLKCLVRKTQFIVLKLTVECIFERVLRKDECVDHIDENKKDNKL